MDNYMAVWEVHQFCAERGYKFMNLFEDALNDYRSDTVDKQTYINCIKEMQKLWDDVKELMVHNHFITARQLINWFFVEAGCVTLSHLDYIIYEKLYLLMCLNRDVSVSALLNSILDVAEYAETETYQEVE
mgnify:CR=1 FL=1